jgi:hypothetical protein
VFGIAGSSHAQQKIEKVKVKIEKCKMKKREPRGNGNLELPGEIHLASQIGNDEQLLELQRSCHDLTSQ